MSDKFTGRWLVTEYNYAKDGQFLGIVEQSRVLKTLTDGAIEVRQNCHPEARLDGHPMSQFKGEWVFNLHRDGESRHYLGPDVEGLGISLGKNSIVGSGRWTRFGYNFTSYGFLVTPERQITGGIFFDQDPYHPMSQIVGIAIPESTESLGQYASLDQTPPTYQHESTWAGNWSGYDNHGALTHEYPFRRCYQNQNWTDIFADDTHHTTEFEALHDRMNRVKYTDPLGHISTGQATQCGCMQIIRIQASSNQAFDQINIYDSATPTLIGLRTWYQSENERRIITGYETYTLTPDR